MWPSRFIGHSDKACYLQRVFETAGDVVDEPLKTVEIGVGRRGDTYEDVIVVDAGDQLPVLAVYTDSGFVLTGTVPRLRVPSTADRGLRAAHRMLDEANPYK